MQTELSPLKFYLLEVAEGSGQSVEVEHVPLAQLTIHQLPLFVKPALGGVMPALKYDVVALKPACEIIPSRRN